MPEIAKTAGNPGSHELTAAVRSLRRDHGDMATELLDLITSDPAVLHGQAVIRGTRVPVTVVLDCLADGMSEDALRKEYPTLPQGVVHAALAYAAALARDEIMPLDPTHG
ncbi:MAG: DUF433 domain-containing protein [Acidimicrobiales bacterium]